MAGSDFARQLEGYGLATVQTHYYMPGYPSQLQMYVMLQYDIAPRFRDLDRFLAFCRREIETVLHSVRAAPRRLIGPSEWRAVDGVISIN